MVTASVLGDVKLSLVKLLNGLKLEATIIMVETPVHHEKLPVDS